MLLVDFSACRNNMQFIEVIEMKVIHGNNTKQYLYPTLVALDSAMARVEIKCKFIFTLFDVAQTNT